MIEWIIYNSMVDKYANIKNMMMYCHVIIYFKKKD